MTDIHERRTPDKLELPVDTLDPTDASDVVPANQNGGNRGRGIGRLLLGAGTALALGIGGFMAGQGSSTEASTPAAAEASADPSPDSSPTPSESTATETSQGVVLDLEGTPETESASLEPIYITGQTPQEISDQLVHNLKGAFNDKPPEVQEGFLQRILGDEANHPNPGLADTFRGTIASLGEYRDQNGPAEFEMEGVEIDDNQSSVTPGDSATIVATYTEWPSGRKFWSRWEFSWTEVPATEQSEGPDNPTHAWALVEELVESLD